MSDVREALQPCPFCGGEAERITIEEQGDNFNGDVIFCKKCGASSHVEFGRKVSRYGTRVERVNGHGPVKIHPLYAHPPAPPLSDNSKVLAAKSSHPPAPPAPAEPFDVSAAHTKPVDVSEGAVGYNQAEPVGLREAARRAHDTLIELNVNNYTHEDVCEANDAAVEAILLLADALGERHGKTEQWWANRRAALATPARTDEGQA